MVSKVQTTVILDYTDISRGNFGKSACLTSTLNFNKITDLYYDLMSF
jgi:hypothetical protein